MSDKLDRFVNLMKGIFELDKSDLDFGIYRIMNIRKAEIEKFLSEGLPAKIADILAPFAQNDIEEIKKKIESIEKQASDFGMDISSLPDDNQMKQQYNSLKAQLAGGTDLSALESDVYSALYNFFNRYYDEGDFISKRRYKEGVYAIPYEGEEVKLYWANQDQYYIKTSENFKDYTFKVEDYSVHFRIVDATTEQNNNKESDDSKRVFMLFTEDEENFPGIKTFEHNADTKEIIIRFVYDIPEDKKRKYAEENYNAVQKYIFENNSTIPVWQSLLAPIPTGKGKKTTTLLEKHMKAYVAKNTFDYFIHKDLKGFLTRELDFYIKSEIMHLDDLDTSNEQRVETYLAKVRAVKRVGAIIIDFLAQIENFQKKLWLKKKFVIETNWCITLDRIDEKFYPEIIENKAQIQEWIDMYAVDEIKDDLTTVGFTNPPTVDFLRQNLNLVVDTKHFSSDFKERLIASIDNLDEMTNGLMFNADNYHAISLLSNRHRSKIKCVYIDPPYNAQSSEILYKNNYKHSSWLTLLSDRIESSLPLLEKNSVYITTIDEVENEKLTLLEDSIFNNQFTGKTTISVLINPSGQQGKNFSTTNEYIHFYYNDENDMLAKEYRDDNTDKRSFMNGAKGKSGNYKRESGKNCFYPIYVKNDMIIGFGDICDNDFHPKANEVLDDGTIAVYPIDNEGVERKWLVQRSEIENKILKIDDTTKRITGDRKLNIIRSKSGITIQQEKFFINFKTIWVNPKYSAKEYGTTFLNNILSVDKTPDNIFPKSIHAVEDCINIAIKESASIVLDYFAGSGTTGNAVLNLNRQDNGKRKYILVEMGEYFNTVTKPRMQKVIYSSDWKDGKPQNRNTGVSHIMKYMKLESYEDALSNISLDEEKHGLSSLFGDDYLINYMLDIEAEGSLLNLDAFRTPFEYKLKVTENNETKEKNVDVVETFNYLIGLTVKTASAITYFNAVKDENGEYEGAVRLIKDISGTYGFKQIEGTTPDGKRVLVIWRTISDNLIESNAALDAYFSKHRINPQDREYDIIYVNGDNNLQNMSTDEDSFKVQMTELEFKKRMFEEE